jgi:hypothetical protein
MCGNLRKSVSCLVATACDGEAHGSSSGRSARQIRQGASPDWKQQEQKQQWHAAIKKGAGKYTLTCFEHQHPVECDLQDIYFYPDWEERYWWQSEFLVGSPMFGNLQKYFLVGRGGICVLYAQHLAVT